MRNINNYCIGKEIYSNFPFWKNLEKTMKRLMLSADLSYHTTKLYGTLGQSKTFDNISMKTVDKLENILFSTNNIDRSELFTIYLNFLTRLTRPIKNNSHNSEHTFDSKEEVKRQEKEDIFFSENRNEIDKEEADIKYTLYSQRVSLNNLVPKANLSKYELAAFNYILNNKYNEDMLAYFSQRGITHLANRASFKLFLSRVNEKSEYKDIHDIENSDISSYPDSTYIEKYFEND